METPINEPSIRNAKNLAKKILKDIDLQFPPISLWKVVEYLKPKYNLEIYAMRDFGQGLSGIRVTEEEISTIGYNQRHSWHRRRFTIAHEIGHVVMGHPNVSSFSNFESKDPCETEANQFAAELLMPLSIIKNDIKNGIKVPQLLAERYNVSPEAMWWRVSKSGLLNKI